MNTPTGYPCLMTLIARVAAVLAALTAALFLSSCSNSTSESHADHPKTDQPVITGQPAGYNPDDVAFATNMIPHHQQAVDLSALVPSRSTDPAVVALAQQISAAQQPEINVMVGRSRSMGTALLLTTDCDSAHSIRTRPV